MSLSRCKACGTIYGGVMPGSMCHCGGVTEHAVVGVSVRYGEPVIQGEPIQLPPEPAGEPD
jgi:hypothetical protein